MNDWIKTKEEVTQIVAREFINQVRKNLVEKGIPLDKGSRDLVGYAMFNHRKNRRAVRTVRK